MQSDTLSVHRRINKDLNVTVTTSNVCSTAERIERQFCNRFYCKVIDDIIFLDVEYYVEYKNYFSSALRFSLVGRFSQ
jgi:hypothetical protein